MKKRKEINYGSGNSFIKITVENLENNFSGYQDVRIVKNADGSKTITATGGVGLGDDGSLLSSSGIVAAPLPPGQSPSALAVKEAQREAILKYVGHTLPLVAESWRENYMLLWEDILNLPEVEAIVYKKGHQQHTTFNRREVLHIICFLGKHAAGGAGIFEEYYNATAISLILKDGREKTTRPELGFNTTKSIQTAIIKLMNSKKYAKRKNGKEK